MSAAKGSVLDISGLTALVSVGDRLTIRDGRPGGTQAEIVSFNGSHVRALPLGQTSGVGSSTMAEATLDHLAASLCVSEQWLGRVIDPLGAPLDGRGAMHKASARPVRAAPPPAAHRTRLGPRLPLGVRVLDLFTTCRTGQRIGLFAGSGVGKSTLLSMLARNAQAEVIVLALIGERGREVREFIEDDLGPAMARSVVVVATSDQPALLRREAAYAAMTVAEYFRDQGRSVLLLMDSVTRFCLALREIGLAAGEPPATRGYPPSVFAELPCLLERAGPGTGRGSITALFTVLVEGSDHDEPIADAVRGILDGHAVLDRQIAETGRYPPVDVSRSLSRTVPGCLVDDEPALVRNARAVLSQAAALADLVRLGAYQHGADPAADRALALAPRIEALLTQPRDPVDAPAPVASIEHAFAALRAIMEPQHAA